MWDNMERLVGFKDIPTDKYLQGYCKDEGLFDDVFRILSFVMKYCMDTWSHIECMLLTDCPLTGPGTGIHELHKNPRCEAGDRPLVHMEVSFTIKSGVPIDILACPLVGYSLLVTNLGLISAASAVVVASASLWFCIP